MGDSLNIRGGRKPLGTALGADTPFIRSPLRHLSIAEIDERAKAETRNREVHLPPISVYRWWARRTEAVNGAILDAVNKDFGRRLLVADPFAGGGVIPLAAVIRNHQVYAQDLNPWAAYGLALMLGLPDPEVIRSASKRLANLAEPLAQKAYATHLMDGQPGMVSHTFRVATSPCPRCGEKKRLFPQAMISLLVRKERGNPAALLACPNGHILRGYSDRITKCPHCGEGVNPETGYASGRVVRCGSCGEENSLENLVSRDPFGWDLVLVERVGENKRELDIPTKVEIEQAESEEWRPKMDLGPIPHGQETQVLRRHGFLSWNDIYPRRQRWMIEQLLALCDRCTEDHLGARILRACVIGSTEMAGFLSRWDRWYLKSYESMAGHRFNFTTFAVEPNVWGTKVTGRGTVIRRITLMINAAEWLKKRTGRQLRIQGPINSITRRHFFPEALDVRVVEGSAERMAISSGQVDLVLTDPPYHDDVQYSELSLPFRTWAGLSTDFMPGDAVVNEALDLNTSRGEYRKLLTQIFGEARRALRTDGHLIFSYANRKPSAWIDLLAALEDAGYRAVGYTIVHSENERDQVKRNVRACMLDLIMDLTPAGPNPVKQWYPRKVRETPEHELLDLVGKMFLKVGSLPLGWETKFLALLNKSTFLNGKKPPDHSVMIETP